METFTDKRVFVGFPAKKIETNSQSEVVVLGDGHALLNANGSQIHVRDDLITPASHAQVMRKGQFSVIAGTRDFAVYSEGKKVSQVAAFRKSISAICFGSRENIFAAGIDEEYVIIKRFDKEKGTVLDDILTRVTVVNDITCSQHDDIAFATNEGGYVLDYKGNHKLISKQENILRIAFNEKEILSLLQARTGYIYINRIMFCCGLIIPQRLKWSQTKNITWVRNMFLIPFFIEVEHWFGFALKLLRNIRPGYGLNRGISALLLMI